MVETRIRVPAAKVVLAWSHRGDHLALLDPPESSQVFLIPSFEALLEGHRDPIRDTRGDYGQLRALARTGDVFVARSPHGLVLSALDWAWNDELGDFDQLGSFVAETFSPDDRFLALATYTTVTIVDVASGLAVATLSAHTSAVIATAFSHDARLLATLGWDHTIRLWSVPSWEPVATITIDESANVTRTNWAQLAFHPSEYLLAGPSSDGSGLSVYAIDPAVARPATPAGAARRYVTAKVVIVGESGVGKTGLGYRMAKGEYREHSSTHGQQFWVAETLGTRRADGVECEVVLWDLAGQPDYRLIHVLFLDDADAALVVFDAARRHDLLDAATFWTTALDGTEPGRCPKLLVAARTDRGNAAVTAEEMQEFARSVGAEGGVLETSALEGRGLDELAARLRAAVPWDELPVVVETPVLASIKASVLRLKEQRSTTDSPIATLSEVREHLAADGAGEPGDQEIEAALRQWQVRGLLHVLRTSAGDRVVLLAPELLNNLAASLILEARRNPRGLGALDEAELLADRYAFPELRTLDATQRQVLIESVTVLLLSRHVCFREQLGDRTLLIFPELINEKPPVLAARPEDLVEDLGYVVTGDITNVYAALVVLLGYTNVLRRVDQWRHQALYDFDGHRLHFRQSRPGDDRLEVVLSYAPDVPDSVRHVFAGLVERFLARQPVTVRRYPRVTCPECGYVLPRSQVTDFMDDRADRTFCPRGGHEVRLPVGDTAPALSDSERGTVGRELDTARDRTLFSVVMTQFRAYLQDSEGRRPMASCFVSYSWGRADVTSWVRGVLVPDLRQAGVDVVLDVTDNLVGDSLTRFVERIGGVDVVLVVGTRDYRRKYENAAVDHGTVVAAEADLISMRLLGTEAQKASVLPVLREGTPDEALTPMMQTRIHADFRDPSTYFPELFRLVRSIFRVDARAPGIQDLVEVIERG